MNRSVVKTVNTEEINKYSLYSVNFNIIGSCVLLHLCRVLNDALISEINNNLQEAREKYDFSIIRKVCNTSQEY